MYFLELVLLLATILIQKECFAGDGSIELRDGPNQIKEYYVKDQCMAQPGYFHLHHFNLAFYLQEHQFCGGGPDGMDGLLICYRGQLDKSGLLPMGLQPNRQFELPNVAGNGVAKRCQELAGPDWHGILINKNDQNNWVFRVSTTNRTFMIDGGKHALNELFFKLASAKDGGESFLSKSFDPYRDFMKWKNDHFGEAEEADNRIRLRQTDNEKLKTLFMERQPMQERLQNYAGIWSVGLDMLPTKEGIDHFVLYVNKSECCKDIKIFFNLPTAQPPNPEMPKIIGEKIEKPVSIFENFMLILDGIIKSNAKNFIFEIIDQLDPKSRIKGMRFTVDFEKNTTKFEEKTENNWTSLGEFQNHFAAGTPFHLVVILRKNGITINVNCNEDVHMNLNTGDEIAVKNLHLHLINITGDYKYWNFNYENKSWSVEKGLDGKNSGGIMLKGKIGENAKMFSIKLWHQKDDGFHEGILELEVNIDSKYYKLFGPNNEEQKTKELSHSYNAGSQFEAIFKFSVYSNKTEIWMDNSLIADPIANNSVHFVQIVGDATANLIEIRKNLVSCPYEMSSKERKSFNIVGKMLPHKEQNSALTIQFITSQNKIHLNMYFVINVPSTVLYIAETFDKEPIKKEIYPLPIKMGEIFHLDIHYNSETEIGLTINEEPEIVFITAKGSFSETKRVEIFDADPVDSFVILEMDMAQDCNNLIP